MSGSTLIERCCLIANPVAGNPTHYMIEQAFANRGLDWRFMTFEVEPAQLGDAIRGIRALGFRGVKVAEPFQESVVEFLDGLSERARRCGSVNAINVSGQELTGDNTEGAALIDLMRPYVNPMGVSAMIVGAGRLARAIAAALVEAGVGAIAVVNRSEAHGQRLVESIQSQSPVAAKYAPWPSGPLPIDAEIALLVNATSLSSEDPEAELPIDPTSLRSHLVVTDVAYNTARTWLTRQAAERGCRVIEGLDLYVEQTASALRAWTDDAPEVAAMREAAEEFLGI